MRANIQVNVAHRLSTLISRTEVRITARALVKAISEVRVQIKKGFLRDTVEVQRIVNASSALLVEFARQNELSKGGRR